MYTVTIYLAADRAHSYDFDSENEARKFYRQQGSHLTKGVLFFIDNIRHSLIGMVDKF